MRKIEIRDKIMIEKEKEDKTGKRKRNGEEERKLNKRRKCSWNVKILVKIEKDSLIIV